MDADILEQNAAAAPKKSGPGSTWSNASSQSNTPASGDALPTGKEAPVRGIFYDVVEGSNGMRHIKREDGRLFAVTAFQMKQSRDVVVPPIEASSFSV
jgi:hypothetical protein